MAFLRVDGTDEIQKAAAYYGRLDQPTRKALRDQAKAWAPTLTRAAAARAKPGPQEAVAKSGRVSVTNKGLVATFGASGSLSSSGRSVPNRRLTGYEFGAHQEKPTTYLSRHRTSKRSMQVTRRTKAGMPDRKPEGYFILPAVARETPRLVSLWVKAITDIARGER